jgi:hypothetical protein
MKITGKDASNKPPLASSNNYSNSKQQQQFRREQSYDAKDSARQEKLQQKRDKQEQQRIDKIPPKGSVINSSATNYELNRSAGDMIASSTKQQPAVYATSVSSNGSQMPNSKSENVLSATMKKTAPPTGGSFLSSFLIPKLTSKKTPQPPSQALATQMPFADVHQQPPVPKGRLRCQVIYLDESVKTFDLDVSVLILIIAAYC